MGGLLPSAGLAAATQAFAVYRRYPLGCDYRVI